MGTYAVLAWLEGCCVGCGLVLGIRGTEGGGMEMDGGGTLGRGSGTVLAGRAPLLRTGDGATGFSALAALVAGGKEGDEGCRASVAIGTWEADRERLLPWSGWGVGRPFAPA